MDGVAKSRFVSPQKRTKDSSPAVYCWEKEQKFVVREADG